MVSDKLWLGGLVENCPVSMWTEDYHEFTKNNQQPSRLPNTVTEQRKRGAELVVESMLKIRNITTVIFKVHTDFLREAGELK